jgi:calcium-dependent protein kinase
VKLYEFFSDAKHYYLVTEYLILLAHPFRYVDGGELFDEIKRRAHFSEQDAALVMNQLLSAVTYCHERHLVHRDLKPENILLDRSAGKNLSIKIIDFGTAKAFVPDSKMHQLLGTPFYIAPEVLMGDYNEKCDVWSCGVILYILLSGTPPFFGKTDKEVMRAVKKGQFTYRGKH